MAKILKKKNYLPDNVKGSHMTFRNPNISNPNRNFVTITMYPEIPPAIVRKILKQMGISRNEFFKLLEEV